MLIFNFIPQNKGYISRIQVKNNVINFYENPEYVQSNREEFAFFCRHIRAKATNPQIAMPDCGNGFIPALTEQHIRLRHENKEETKIYHSHVLFRDPLSLDDLENIMTEIDRLQNDYDFMYRAAQLRTSTTSKERHLFIEKTDSQAFLVEAAKIFQKRSEKSLEKKVETNSSATYCGFEAGFFYKKKSQPPQQSNQLSIQTEVHSESTSLLRKERILPVPVNSINTPIRNPVNRNDDDNTECDDCWEVCPLQ